MINDNSEEILRYIENHWLSNDLVQDNSGFGIRNIILDLCKIPRSQGEPATATEEKSFLADRIRSGDGGVLRKSIMRIGRVSLPHNFIAPNPGYFAGTQFYWDSYFTILGLVTNGHVKLAKNMIDNLCFLFDKFGLVPARNSWTSVGRSQPPFLTSMAFEVFEHGGVDVAWMDYVMNIAQQEYERVWMSEPRYNHKSGLSQYNPKYFGKLLAVFESGWDLSSRYSGNARLLPVDLNCLIYKYESDFLKWAVYKNDKTKQLYWRAAMKRRKKLINDYFWDEKSGFYNDYNLKTNRLEKLKTLAGFYPLWCGVADKKQAGKCLKMLKAFEHAGGLATTVKMKPSHKQWDYPNGWAPLQLVVIEGLSRYGFEKDAERLTRKWLDCNQKVFAATATLWEKYDVVNCRVGLRGRYATQPDFSWTMAVFVRLQSRTEHKSPVPMAN